MSEFHGTNGTSLPTAGAVLEMLHMAETEATVCALLTPAIKATLKELEPGQVLLVRVDDPSARLDIQAWCGMTGNVLLAALEEDGVLSFYIEKQGKKQEVQGNG